MKPLRWGFNWLVVFPLYVLGSAAEGLLRWLVLVCVFVGTSYLGWRRFSWERRCIAAGVLP